MLPTTEDGTSDGRTALDNATVRTVFIVGPDKKIKLFLTYPMATGRNFNELLRVIDSLQLTAKHKVATPADWKKGEEVIIGIDNPQYTTDGLEIYAIEYSDGKKEFVDRSKLPPELFDENDSYLVISNDVYTVAKVLGLQFLC